MDTRRGGACAACPCSPAGRHAGPLANGLARIQPQAGGLHSAVRGVTRSPRRPGHPRGPRPGVTVFLGPSDAIWWDIVQRHFCKFRACVYCDQIILQMLDRAQNLFVGRLPGFSRLIPRVNLRVPGGAARGSLSGGRVLLYWSTGHVWGIRRQGNSGNLCFCRSLFRQ